MKKYLFLIITFLISLSVFSQTPRSRVLLGQDTSTGKGGLKYYDTLKTLVCSGCSFTRGLFSDTLVIGTSSQWTTSGSDIYYSTGKVTIGSSTINRLLTLDNATPPLFGLSVSGTEKLLMGISNGANNLIPGTVAGDFAMRSVSGLFFSADGGTTNHLSIANSGDVTIGAKLGVGRAPTTKIDAYTSNATNFITSQSGLATGIGALQGLNNSGNAIQLGSTGSTYGASGILNSNYSFIQSNGSVALVLQTAGVTPAPIVFGINIGGTIAQVGQFNTTGKLWLNQTTNIATSQFEVTQAGGNPQITTAYDATHYTTWNTGSGGILTIAPTGTQVNITGHAVSSTTATYDLGTSSLIWRDVYLSHPVGKSTIGVSSGLGTNVTSVTPAGSDAYFNLTVVTSATATGTIGLVAFGRTWGATPYCVVSAANAATGAMIASAGGYVALNATSTTSMTLAGLFTGAGTWVFNCHCGQ